MAAGSQRDGRRLEGEERLLDLVAVYDHDAVGCVVGIAQALLPMDHRWRKPNLLFNVLYAVPPSIALVVVGHTLLDAGRNAQARRILCSNGRTAVLDTNRFSFYRRPVH